MKYEHTRLVVFKEDYYVRAKGVDENGKPSKKLLHSKGSRHAMHKGVVDILLRNKAKIEVTELDFKKIEAKVKRRKEEAKKKAFEVR